MLDTQKDDEDKTIEAPDAITGKRSAPVKEAMLKRQEAAKTWKGSLKNQLQVEEMVYFGLSHKP